MLSRAAARPQVSTATVVQAPTGGLNDFDPISNMPPQFLLECTNFFPDNSQLLVRPGYQEWATNLDAPVDTIMAYVGLDGGFQRFAATENGIYDITSPTSAPALVKAAANGYWEYVNFATAAKQYLVAANGIDAPVLYDGTTWTSFTNVTTPSAPGEVSGLDVEKISFVMNHKGRLWFIEKNSMNAWYLPVDSVGGVLQPFYLGGIFRFGGNLVSIARWSADTGSGIDDRLVFASSAGEVASYSGNDPSDALDWFNDSTFFIAPPVGRRGVAPFGGDLLMLCKQGMVPLSSLISTPGGESIFSKALTRRISRTLMRIIAGSSQPFPPEVCVFNDLGWVVINIFNGVPDATSPSGVIIGDSNRPVQFVMNTMTGAWGKFDYPVRTVRTIDSLFFMGTDDGRVVVVTPNSYVDNIKMDGTGGDPITASAMSAYTLLDNPNASKHAKLIQPVLQTEVKPSFVLRVLPDYRLDRFLQVPAPAPATSNAKWDLSNWDSSNWASTENAYKPWVSANSLGYAFAWQIRVSTSSALGITSVKWMWENGGLI